jgi:hypothetical protein
MSTSLERFGSPASTARLDLDRDGRMPENLDLPGLAPGPERPPLAAERLSQKRAAFPGLETGPVKGMGI